MPRQFITYHIGARTLYLDAAQVIAYRAELKTIIAYTEDREIVLDCHESACNLLEEFAPDFIWIRRGTIVRKSAVHIVTPINDKTFFHDGGLVWLRGKVQPLRASRNGIALLDECKFLTKNKETKHYENHARTAATIEETEPTMANRTNAGSARQVSRGAA